MEQAESVERLSSPEIHTHSFWLYSVIVGLSVEEALRHVLPHVGEISLSMGRNALSEISLEFVRLALFLCLVVRFYLGAVRFFNLAHLCSTCDTDYPTKNYTIDFFFGLLHFSAFLALSLSIDAKQDHTIFLFWLSFIILYDFVWLLACRRYDTFHLVKLWAFLNGLTFVLGMVFYFVPRSIFSYFGASELLAGYWCEVLFMLPVFFFSFIDIREVFKAQPIFATWFGNLLKSKKDKSNG